MWGFHMVLLHTHHSGHQRELPLSSFTRDRSSTETGWTRTCLTRKSELADKHQAKVDKPDAHRFELGTAFLFEQLDGGNVHARTL